MSALAFAAKTTANPVAIATYARILQKRLVSQDASFEVFPSSFGLSMVAEVTNRDEAINAARSVEIALSSQVDPKQLDENTIDQLRKTLSARQSPDPGEIALAHCSGELLVDATQLNILNDKFELLASVERARIEMYSRNNARFAFVGTRDVALAVELTLSKFRSWPLTQSAKQAFVEPPMSSPRIGVSRGSSRSISIAWQVDSLDAAGYAAKALRKNGSPLLAQVAALETEWKVDSITASARNAGACLRMDFSANSDKGAISPANLETIVRIATSESQNILQGSTGAVRDLVVNPSDADPRRAARSAAWNSLSSSERSNGQALQVQLRTTQADGPSPHLESAVREGLTVKPVGPLEAAYRVESGQSEQWALLASTCGTLAESADDAGSVAAWVRALAKRYSGHLGVRIEPWLTADGIGFIAHCPAQSRAESPTELATRLGNALGSVIATGSVNGMDLAAVREDTLLRLGPAPRRAWWQLVDLVSPNHPSSLEPLGSFDSMRKLGLTDLRASRLKWLHGPLRLSSLLNQSETQLKMLTAPLHRWLDPHRTDARQCTQSERGAAHSSDVQISTRILDTRDPNLYVAIQLAPDFKENLVYEHWLLWLLARPGGWAERTLEQVGTLSSFNAEAKGPRNIRSLVVGVNVADESKLADCTLRLRALFTRLAESGADAQEVGLAQRWSDAQIRRAELDPRRRLVDLWWGDSVPQKTQLSGFSRYLKQSFGSAAVTVVHIHRQP